MASTITSVVEFNNLTSDEKMSEIFKAVLKIPNIQQEIQEIKTSLEFSIADVEAKVDDVKATTSVNRKEIERVESDFNIRNIKRDLYDRRWNILIHGVEDDITRYEDYSVSEEKVREILRDALKLPNWETMVISDCHRLPQKPLKLQRNLRSGKKKRRPLIFKVTTRKDCNAVWDNVSNLKEFNDDQSADDKIYITKHLPKQLQDQKKALQKVYNKAKLQYKETEWKIDYDAGEINLLVDGVKVTR